jgi:GTP-binding protein
MSKPVIAIVGRPNVGKSTLFNKLTGKRISIVEDIPGVTRDRIYSEGEWLNKKFTLIDTGGIELGRNDKILTHIKEQAQIAIETANVILFVTDIKSGVTPEDIDVAQILLKSGKPIILVVNKCDSIGKVPDEIYEFYSLGLGEPFPVSSVHGHGTGDILDECFRYIDFNENRDIDENRISVAVVGRPNVGKSSLVNRIIGHDRMIVHNESGTTRDAVDSYVENEYGNFVFTDTAGMRKKGKVESGIERYSVIRALAAIDRSNVCIIMIDGTQGFAEQDSKIAGYAHEQGKGCVIAVNKWDAVEKDSKTMDEMKMKLKNDFSFMSYAPIIFISAKTGQGIDKLFYAINTADEQNSFRATTGVLNDILSRAVARVQPPSDKGKQLKIYYMTQISTRPPTFATFCNDRNLFHFSYERYIENQIRDAFGLVGTPIRILVRERGE